MSCVFLDYEAVSLLWFCYSVVVEDAGEESLGFYWAWMVGNLIESKSLIKAFFYPSITVNFFSNYAIFTRWWLFSCTNKEKSKFSSLFIVFSISSLIAILLMSSLCFYFSLIFIFVLGSLWISLTISFKLSHKRTILYCALLLSLFPAIF